MYSGSPQVYKAGTRTYCVWFCNTREQAENRHSAVNNGPLLMYLDKSVSCVQQEFKGVSNRHQNLLYLVLQHQGAGRKQALCCEQWYFAHVSGQVSLICTAEVHRCIKQAPEPAVFGTATPGSGQKTGSLL